MTNHYDIDWGKVGSIITAVFVSVGGVIITVFTPLFDSTVYRSITRNPEKYDALRRESLIRDKANTKVFIQGLFETELQERTKTAQMSTEALTLVHAHSDSLEAFQTSLTAQGIVLRDHIKQVFEPLVKTLQDINDNLSDISKCTNENSISIARIEGAMDSEYSGAERRKIARRKPND